MSWWFVSFNQLKLKRLSAFLSILLLSFGVGVISLMLAIQSQVSQTFEKNIKGIDLVVGAKGSPLQIILSSVYHMDAPTGNISALESKEIAGNPMVKLALPLSFGDSYRGYRILGTTEAFLTHYNCKFQKGKTFTKPMHVVLGSTAALRLGLKLGDTFVGNHGLQEESIEEHSGHKFEVVGILAPTNSVVDQLIVTSLNSVWDVHNHDVHQHDSKKVVQNMLELDDNLEITSMLLTFKSKMAAFTLPRKINSTGNLQAALPAIEVNRLMGLLGVGIETLKTLAYIIVIISAISVFISLLSNLKENKYELALLRSFGASPFTLFKVVIQQGLIISVLGYIMGLTLSKIGVYVINSYAESSYHVNTAFNVFSITDFYLLCLTLLLGCLSALIPALTAYRMNISKVLSHA